jgi:hypothetical protein
MKPVGIFVSGIPAKFNDFELCKLFYSSFEFVEEASILKTQINRNNKNEEKYATGFIYFKEENVVDWLSDIGFIVFLFCLNFIF